MEDMEFEEEEQRHHDAKMARLAKEKAERDALLQEVERLTTALHKNRCHPDYSYVIVPEGSPVEHLADWERCPETVLSGGDVCWRRKREA